MSSFGRLDFRALVARGWLLPDRPCSSSSAGLSTTAVSVVVDYSHAWFWSLSDSPARRASSAAADSLPGSAR